MNWISVDERLPEPDQRVLCYSPDYADSEHDQAGMTYRMLSGSMLRYCADVTHWFLPNPPITNR